MSLKLIGFRNLVRSRTLVEGIRESFRENKLNAMVGTPSTGKTLHAMACLEEYPYEFNKVVVSVPLRSLRDDIYFNLDRDDKILLRSKEEMCNLHKCSGDFLKDMAECLTCPLRKAGTCSWYRLYYDVRDRKSFIVVTTHSIYNAVAHFARYSVIDEVDSMFYRLLIYKDSEVKKIIERIKDKEAKRRFLSSLSRNFNVEKRLIKKGGEFRIEKIYFYSSKADDLSKVGENSHKILATATLPDPLPSDIEYYMEGLGWDYEILNTLLKLLSLNLVDFAFRKTMEVYSDLNVIALKNLFTQDRVWCYSHRHYITLGRSLKTGIKYTCLLSRHFVEAEGRTVGIIAPNKKIGGAIYYNLSDISDRVSIVIPCGKLSRGLNIDKDVIIAWYQLPQPMVNVKGLDFILYYFYSLKDKRLSLISELVKKTIEYASNIQALFRFIRNWRKPHIVILLDNRWIRALKWFKTTREYLSDNKLNYFRSLKEFYEFEVKK